MCDISHNNTTKESTLQVVVYSKENGETPFRDFLKRISPKMRTKVLWTIELLKEKGIELREPYSAPLKDGLFELRTKVGSDIVRCLYFFHKGHIVILSNGFVKKTDRTPRREIEKAKRNRADWIRRNTR